MSHLPIDPHADSNKRAWLPCPNCNPDCPHCREYLRQMRQTIAAARALTERDVDAMPADVRERLLEAFRERD